MSGEPVETEVKFYLSRPDRLAARLVELQAALVQERVLEANLRFDRPGGELLQARQVLRLRLDSRARLTFKGPADISTGVSARQEIELEVDDFHSARSFLEALGYRVVVMYEKYRTTYQMGDALVTIDEMPYGVFAEIEGRDATGIRSLARMLNLDWEARSLDSYLGIFGRLQQAGLQAENLSFAELKDIHFSPADLGLTAADTRP